MKAAMIILITIIILTAILFPLFAGYMIVAEIVSMGTHDKASFDDYNVDVVGSVTAIADCPTWVDNDNAVCEKTTILNSDSSITVQWQVSTISNH